MTAYTLMARHNEEHPYSHFFDKETLSFFGERLSEMRVLKDTTVIKDVTGQDHICYVLSSLQRKAPGGPKRTYHYFDVNNYDHVIT